MHQNYKNFVKLAVFEAGNPLEKGRDLRKFRKKKTRQISHFRKKSLEMGKGFRPRGAQPVEK